MSEGIGRNLNYQWTGSMNITHIDVDHGNRTPAVRMPPHFISIRECRANKEASVVKICSGANADIEPWQIIPAEKVGRLIGWALRAFCTTEPPDSG